MPNVNYGALALGKRKGLTVGYASYKFQLSEIGSVFDSISVYVNSAWISLKPLALTNGRAYMTSERDVVLLGRYSPPIKLGVRGYIGRCELTRVVKLTVPDVRRAYRAAVRTLPGGIGYDSARSRLVLKLYFANECGSRRAVGNYG